MHRFGEVQTFPSYILTEIARYIEFFYMSSGWFDWLRYQRNHCFEKCSSGSSVWKPDDCEIKLFLILGALINDVLEPHRTHVKVLLLLLYTHQ